MQQPVWYLVTAVWSIISQMKHFSCRMCSSGGLKPDLVFIQRTQEPRLRRLCSLAIRAEKAANLSKLKRIHADMGWRLLMNEHVMIQHESDQIAVAGVEKLECQRRFPKVWCDTALRN